MTDGLATAATAAAEMEARTITAPAEGFGAFGTKEPELDSLTAEQKAALEELRASDKEILEHFNRVVSGVAVAERKTKVKKAVRALSALKKGELTPDEQAIAYAERNDAGDTGFDAFRPITYVTGE